MKRDELPSSNRIAAYHSTHTSLLPSLADETLEMHEISGLDTSPRAHDSARQVPLALS